MQKALNRIFYSPLPILVVWIVLIISLIYVSVVNYLLFHIVSELFSIVIGFTIYVITWNARAQVKNTALLVLGISFLFTGMLDLLHTLAFRGMDLLPGALPSDPNPANLATQLWMAARFLQSGAIASLPFLYRRRVRPAWIMLAFIMITALLLLSIFVWRIFPASLLDTTGLTSFKRVGEYAIIFGILVGMVGMYRLRDAFDPAVLRPLLLAFGFTILSELTFTEYLSVSGMVNALGHIFKIVAFYFVYKAIVEVGLKRPQDLLFRELAQRQARLEASEHRERERAAQMQAIMDAAPAVVWIAHDRDARVITGNRASYQILRMDPDRNLSMSAPAGHSPDHFRVLTVTGRELSPDELPVQVAARTGQPVLDFEEIVAFDDGEEVRLIGNVAPLFDEHGQPAGAVGAFIDITARARAEKAMLESEARFRGLFESMTESFALLEQTPGQPLDFHVIELNPAFERMTGVKRADLVGKSVQELLGEQNIWWLERVSQVTRTGTPDYLEDFPLISGRRFEVVVYAAGERQVALLGIDVTDRFESQQALSLSEARLRRLVDANIIGITYFDDQGAIIQANDAFLNMVGYTRADFKAGLLNWASLTPPEYAHFDRQRMDEAKARGACTPYEKEYLRKDGSRMPVLVGWAYFDGDPGAPFIGFSVDLTVQKRADEASREYAAALERINIELARANGELQDFAFMASHDLQEPLRKIQAFGERLSERERSRLSEESRDYLERMLSAANRMRSMINDLLSLSRVTTRARPFQRVDLNEVAQQVLADLEVRLERSGGRVELGDLPAIDADPTQMHQLFLNLIGNALKFHHPDIPPVVEVRSDCTNDEKSVIISVQDNGIGFDENFLPRIFQPFQRLHGRSEYEGSGIGLAVCRKIVERHAGEITARSAPSEGATFIVRLPVHQDVEKRQGADVYGSEAPLPDAEDNAPPPNGSGNGTGQEPDRNEFLRPDADL